jgi:hypothetical protein
LSGLGFNYYAKCDPAGIRTQDPYIKSVLLYQLSYGIGSDLFFSFVRGVHLPEPRGDKSEFPNPFHPDLPILKAFPLLRAAKVTDD